MGDDAPRRSAIVVGATGFVGRHLVEELRKNDWRVIALHREGSSRARLFDGTSIESRAISSAGDFGRILSEVDVGHIFHLAAHQSRGDSTADIELFLDANLRLTMHIFRAAAEHHAKVVSALSYFQYREGQPVAHSLYSATKLAQAEFARYWREVVGVDIRDVVLFDNYGPQDERSKLIPALIHAARTGEEIVVGPREQRLDLLHVRDVAAGLIAVADDRDGGMLAVRASSIVTVGDVIDTISEIAGTPVRAVVDPDRNSGVDPTHAGTWRKPSGWSPTIDLREGIQECMI